MVRLIHPDRAARFRGRTVRAKLFAVAKKDGKQRLICDRRANNAMEMSVVKLLELQMGEGHVLVLAFSDARRLPYCCQFTDLIFFEGETLRIGQDDLSDYFFQLAWPTARAEWNLIESPVRKEDVADLLDEAAVAELGESQLLEVVCAAVQQGMYCLRTQFELGVDHSV